MPTYCQEKEMLPVLYFSERPYTPTILSQSRRIAARAVLFVPACATYG